MKLHLGCGQDLKPGWLNVDLYERPAGVDPSLYQRVDLTHQWPWPDNGIAAIEADNVMEHFDNREFLHVMNCCHRVLLPGAQLWFRVPDAERWFDGAFGDPTHKRYFVPRSFLYFDINSDQWRNYGRHYGFLPWWVTVIRDNPRPPVHWFDVTCLKPEGIVSC